MRCGPFTFLVLLAFLTACAPPATDTTYAAVGAELAAIAGSLEPAHDRIGVLFGSLGPGGGAVDVAGEIAPGEHLRLASLSKVFLAFMVLREGLDPDATIDAYYPADRYPAADAISIRHLLNHTSGIPDELAVRMHRHGVGPDPAEALAGLRLDEAAASPDARIDEVYNQEVGLDFEPGTRWCYSNTGYTMLGRILERHTGEPFERLLARHFGAVAPSLRLDDGREAAFPGSYVSPWPVHWSQPWVAGGLVAPARDALAAFRYVSQQPELERMQSWADQPRCDREIVFGDDYGRGLQRYALEGVGDAIGHDGHMIARSLLLHRGDTVFLLHVTRYVENAELKAMAERLLRAGGWGLGAGR